MQVVDIHPFTLMGLGSKSYSENPKKVVQKILAEKLKEKTELIIWHDDLSTSISAHISNGNRPPNFSELPRELKSCNDRLRTLVYSPRDRTPDISNLLKQQ